MKTGLYALVVILVTGIAFAQSGGTASAGEALFKQHCTACHADGGNIINPQKALHKKALNANNIKTAGDIVKTMRSPGPGMPKFDEKSISEQQARQIADYVLKTFK